MKDFLNNKKIKLVIIGLGYVGLPLLLEFAKKRNVIGFDTNENRIKELKEGIDKNFEFTKEDFKVSNSTIFTSNYQDLILANCFIITVPTPIDNLKKPDLSFIEEASRSVGRLLKKNDVIIYESTVYPGCIEDKCIPLLEKFSKLKFNKDFFCGYSPERINPGDKIHTISNIKKITSGSTPEVAELVDNLYKEIVIAGTYKAPSIKIAEAAKVIENTQRDLNIALVNELSIIFAKMNIDTQSVLEAAGTKWNFLPFKPGLVGGHCIGVDPYYLTYKAESIGYTPKVILAGRDTNDKMGTHVASRLIHSMKKKNISINNSRILVMGLTFKENCADIRNSGVENVVKELTKNGCDIDLYDPWTQSEEIYKVYNKYSISTLNNETYDAIVIAVAHNNFKSMGIKSIKKLGKKNCIIFDLKSIFPIEDVDLRL
jgi:UDP-N-acetyl-D-galactosamine dehydrogenase